MGLDIVYCVVKCRCIVECIYVVQFTVQTIAVQFSKVQYIIQFKKSDVLGFNCSSISHFTSCYPSELVHVNLPFLYELIS